MLTHTELALVHAATDLIDRRQGNDDHSVAAAATDTAGTVHTGLNVHHFSGGPCAELVVLGQAAAHSDALPLTTIVAALDGGRGVIPPCGRCRQVLFDYFPHIHVIVHGKNGLESVPVTELLPHVFDWRAFTPETRQRIYLHPAYLAQVRDGGKTSTIRFQDPISVGPATLVFDTDDGTVNLDAEVTTVDHTTVRDLTDADAVRDGFTDRDHLRAALDYHYPGITADNEIVIVHFTRTQVSGPE